MSSSAPQPHQGEAGRPAAEEAQGAGLPALARMRQDDLLGKLVAACDIGVLCGSFVAAYWIRDQLVRAGFGSLSPFGNYLWILWVILPTWTFLLRRVGFFGLGRYRSLQRLLVGLLEVHGIGALVLLSSMYLSRSEEVSRLLLQTFLAVSFVGLLAEKVAVRWVVFHPQRRAPGLARVLVVGTDATATRYVDLVRSRPHWGVDVIGFLAADGGAAFCGAPVLGRSSELSRVLDSHVVDEVVVSSRADDLDLEALARMCVERGISFHTLIGMPQGLGGKHNAVNLDRALYLLSLQTIPQDTAALLAKRSLDILGGIVGLLVCALTYLWYAPRLRRDSPGPVFFSQTRVGQNGRLFKLYKFRTMCLDAEEKLKALRSMNEMDGHLFKMRSDPRVTPRGRLLRRYHLDELPQFWNVLKGEMSLVGTRPPTTDEVKQYLPHHRRRLSLPPGITGLWQLKGNDAVRDFETVVALDCEYIDTWSLWLDCRILVKTVAKVFEGRGW